jgi:hypothetical protein
MATVGPYRALISSIAARTWVAFSVTSFAVGALYCLIAGENPIARDDPYILGFGIGLFASACSFLLVAAATCGVSRAKLRYGYLTLLGLLGLWAAADLVTPTFEGHGLASILAVALGIVATLAFYAHAVRLGTPSLLLASIPGVVFLICYIAMLASQPIRPVLLRANRRDRMQIANDHRLAPMSTDGGVGGRNPAVI